VRSLLAILLLLFAALPHPALLAGVAAETSGPCRTAESCAPACQCCPQHECPCAISEDPPSFPQPSAPVRGSDFHPVPALPPLEIITLPGPACPELKAGMVPSAADRALTLPLLPLHVRLCVFLN